MGRRLFACAMLELFFHQSSGSAIAASANTGPALELDLASIIAPLRSAIETSAAYALVTGNYARYARKHAGVPVFHHVRVTEPRPHFDRSRLVHYRVKMGSPVFTAALRHPGHPHDSRPDPMLLHPAQAPLAGGLRRLRPLRGPRTRANASAAVAAALPASVTGINRWWDYQEHAIPGVGKAMVNVTNGNALLSITDIDIPERGIDLALRRTYNSMSLHDADNHDPDFYDRVGWASGATGDHVIFSTQTFTVTMNGHTYNLSTELLHVAIMQDGQMVQNFDITIVP
jgi:hypothetical protein